MFHDFPFLVKSVGAAGEFTGLASVYGNVDLGGDVVDPGAFSATLEKHGAEVPVLWAHDMAAPVGLGTLRDTAEGLAIAGVLDLDVQAGREAYSRLKKKIVRGLSVGYRIVADTVQDGVRHLKEITLYEVSLVAVPMNQRATITAVKSQIATIRDFEDFLRSAGYSKRQAVALAACGFKGLAAADTEEEDAGAVELLEWLRGQAGQPAA